MPERFLKMYDPEKIELPENFREEVLFDPGVLKIRDEVLADYLGEKLGRPVEPLFEESVGLALRRLEGAKADLIELLDKAAIPLRTLCDLDGFGLAHFDLFVELGDPEQRVVVDFTLHC